MSVRHAVVSAGYQLHLSDVKTASGRRVINIDDRTVAALAERRSDVVGIGTTEAFTTSLVFGGSDGEAVHPELITRSFDRLVARHSLPRIRFHDIRHTAPQGRRPREGRQRAARSRHPWLHLERVPARAAGHAGRGG